MEEFICQVESQNPGEMAHHILNRVMEYAGAAPLDDMTILVTGIWKLQNIIVVEVFASEIKKRGYGLYVNRENIWKTCNLRANFIY